MTEGMSYEEMIESLLDEVHEFTPELLVIAVGMMIVEVSKACNSVDWIDIITRLRARNSRIFLLSMSIKDPKSFIAALPHIPEKEFPYQLYVCIHGEEEYKKELIHEGITHEKNLARFSETGLLVMRSGTELSRMTKAEFN